MFSLPSAGQSTLGSITGTVLDTSGASVADTRIAVTSIETNVVLNTATTSAGVFNVVSLTPGHYRVEADKTGFEKTAITSVSVFAGQTVTADITLRVGSAATTVTVNDQAPLLTPDSQEIATTIEHDLIKTLPYPEHNALVATMLVAGVRGDPNYGGQIQSENPGIYGNPVAPGAQISVGGGWPGRSSIMIDGSDVTQTSLPRAGASVSGDLVEETTVITGGLPAQYGRTQGGVILQATRSGTNQFHGGLTWFHTDPAFQSQPLGQSTPPQLHQNLFGIYAGGPVWIPKIYNGRNRTFFYVGVEPTRISNIVSSQARVPTPDELAGKFNNSFSLIDNDVLTRLGADAALAAPRVGALYYQYPVNAQGFPSGPQYQSASQYVPIPNNDVSAQVANNKLAQFLGAQFPTPQNPGPYFHFLRPDGLWVNNGNNVDVQQGVRDTDNRYSFRIDHQFNQTDRIFGRWASIPINGVRFLGFTQNSPVNPDANDLSLSKNFSIHETHVFSPTIVNDLRILYLRNRQFRGSSDAALSQDWAGSLGLTPASEGRGFPAIYTDNYQALGNEQNGGNVDANYQFGDDLNWTVGRHNLKLGVDIRRLQSNQTYFNGAYGGKYYFGNYLTNNGSIGGNSLAAIDLGLIGYFQNQPASVPAYYRWHYYAGYIQDDFKLRPNLTVNLGLRWEMETPRMEKYNQQGSFLPDLTGTLNGLPAKGAFCFSGACGLGETLWPRNYKGFQPRIGIAWSPNRYMTVRTSYDILRVPLTGYGSINPNFNVPSQSVGGVNGGVTPNQAVDFITNPVGPLTSTLSGLQGPGPFFSVQGTGVPFVDQSKTVPYTQQWTFALQFQVTKSTLIQTSYNGISGTHLIGNYFPLLNFPGFTNVINGIKQGANFNQMTPNPYGISQGGAPLTENGLQRLFPYQNFFNQDLQEYLNRSGTSSYQGFYLSGTQRSSFGLTMVASFSWSKSIDSVGGDLNTSTLTWGRSYAQNQYDTRAERSLSTFDIPTKLTVGYTYELPLGRNKALSTHVKAIDAVIGNWVTSGIYNVQSGYPFWAAIGAGYFISPNGTPGTPGFTTSRALPSWTTLRPDVVQGENCINSDWRADPFNRPYINSDYFSVPGSLGNPAFGNAARTLGGCRSPRMSTFDANIYRRFQLGADSRRYIEVGLNAQNALNHPIFIINPNGGHNVYNDFNTASLRDPSVPAFSKVSGFGTVYPGNTALLPRVVQLSVRLYW